MIDSVARFAADLVAGRIKILDLTHTLAPDFPVMVLPPELGQCAPFRQEEVSRYDERGPAWYWNNVSFSEHAGTHFDAPAHWISGRDLPAATVDLIAPQNFIAPANVIDCSEQAAADADFLLTVKILLAWEAEHGQIEPGSWVLLRTDWDKKVGSDDYLNLRDDGQHTPGPDAAVMKFLVEQRDIIGFGTETVGTDAGQASHFAPPYPAHFFLHGKGRYGLQCLAGLDQLPPKGALIVAAPLKMLRGSGSPLRVLALVAGPRQDS